MSPRYVLASLVVTCLRGGVAVADACPPAVALSGDAAMVGAVTALLAQRGIDAGSPGCVAVPATVTLADDGWLVTVTDAGGAVVARTVDGPQAAATAIESVARVDLAAPLLASRPVPIMALGPAAPTARADVSAEPAQHRAASRGVLAWGTVEASAGSDRTQWLGAQLGVCVMLGPVCGAARLRIASVVAGPGAWTESIERRGTELLLGIDIPLVVRGVAVAPGFAAGLGQMHTRGATREMRAETGGLRADVHATVSLPVRRRLSLDLSAAVDLTQETRVEWGPTMAPLPDEPRVLTRVGVGLRYGGP